MDMIRKAAPPRSPAWTSCCPTRRSTATATWSRPAGWDLADVQAQPDRALRPRQRLPDRQLGTTSGSRAASCSAGSRWRRQGTSQRIDELRSLVEQGILRAVSVGFLPIESKPMEKGVALTSSRNWWRCSLVAVPANPNGAGGCPVAAPFRRHDPTGLRRARRGGQAVVRRSTGEHAATHLPSGKRR